MKTSKIIVIGLDGYKCLKRLMIRNLFYNLEIYVERRYKAENENRILRTKRNCNRAEVHTKNKTFSHKW